MEQVAIFVGCSSQHRDERSQCRRRRRWTPCRGGCIRYQVGTRGAAGGVTHIQDGDTRLRDHSIPQHTGEQLRQYYDPYQSRSNIFDAKKVPYQDPVPP